MAQGVQLQAAKWYRLAVAQGMSGSQYNLGEMYLNGVGVPKSPSEATRLFNLAALQGFPPAQFNLGATYVNSDKFIKSHAWFSIAAESMGEQARGGISFVEKMMTRGQIAEARKLRLTYKKRIKEKMKSSLPVVY